MRVELIIVVPDGGVNIHSLFTLCFSNTPDRLFIINLGNYYVNKCK